MDATERPSGMWTFLKKWLVWCGVLFWLRTTIVVSLNQPGPYNEALIAARFMLIIVALANLWLAFPIAALIAAIRHRRSRNKLTMLAAGALAAWAALEVPGRYGAYARPRAVHRIVPQLDSARDALRAYVARHGEPPRRPTELPRGTPIHTIRGCTALEIGDGHLWSFCQLGFGTDDVISERWDPQWHPDSVVAIAPGWWYRRSPLIP